MLKFGRNRWWAFGVILALLYFFATLGLWVGTAIPLLGTAFFVVGLMLWYIPGILFSWTGFFRFHEFGADPTGWQGHAIMLVFYGCVAALLSWPLGRIGKPKK